MQSTPLQGPEADLVTQFAAACQGAIGRALAEPSEAMAIAKGLESVLATLSLVQGEVAKGEDGIQAVTMHADALTRGALKDALRYTSAPSAALAVLDSVTLVAPSPPPKPVAAGPASSCPTFGQVSADYIKSRGETDGVDHSDIKYLKLRRETFLAICGDRPVDQYYPYDLQDYVNRMQFWPANSTKRSAMADQSVLEILAGNEDRSQKPLARKTLQDGYVANVRTMMRHGMAHHRYSDPFANAKLRWPKVLAPSVPREGIGLDVLSQVFREGVASGLLDEAILPLLSALTSRRLGLLLHMQGKSIRKKHGVYVAQVGGIALVDGKWVPQPLKTDESATYFVLHDFLSQIGFVEWAMKRDGFIFARAHTHPDPSKYMSKAMNRLLRRCGAAGGNAEVFHSLRGDAIDKMRRDMVKARATRLQSGHELPDVHERYGHRALDPEECQMLAHVPLPRGLDFTVFQGLDFDALAEGRRTRGRPVGKRAD